MRSDGRAGRPRLPDLSRATIARLKLEAPGGIVGAGRAEPPTLGRSQSHETGTAPRKMSALQFSSVSVRFARARSDNEASDVSSLYALWCTAPHSTSVATDGEVPSGP